MEPVIHFQNFGFKYDAQAESTLKNINLDVMPGEKILIAGASGSGKSTIGNCINGLIPFSYPGTITGTLTVAGKEVKNSSIFELSHTVGTVLQDTDGQFIGLTVAEDIAFALENDCTEQGKMKDIVEKVAGIVDMDEFLSSSPFELSGGQKQRVSLAGVMVDEVKVLLFDEPLANLDPAAGRATIELIDEIQKRTGAAVIIIEHRLEDVLWKNVDRIVLMNDGEIVADMNPDELLSSNLLKEHGIREPLYLTALKYAGIEIAPQMKPQGINDIIIDESIKEKLSDWFLNQKKAEKSSDTRKNILIIDKVNFGYDDEKKTLKDISFSIKKGEMVSIVGRNGAGKSTIAKLICGFERVNSGRIFLEGEDISDTTIKDRAKKIGYVMQNPNQMISKPMIWDEVEMALINSGVPEKERKERIEETLKICGLYPFRKWPVSALSYGQKKRVTIASILVQKPEVIILDEPTAGQDYHHYTEIMEFLKELNDRGYTIIMITHDMHLMLEYTERAIVFNRGRMLADTTPAAVLTNPKLIMEASLKETSLYTLCERCGIDEPLAFTECFINWENRVRYGRCEVKGGI